MLGYPTSLTFALQLKVEVGLVAVGFAREDNEEGVGTAGSVRKDGKRVVDSARMDNVEVAVGGWIYGAKISAPTPDFDWLGSGSKRQALLIQISEAIVVLGSLIQALFSCAVVALMTVIYTLTGGVAMAQSPSGHHLGRD
ncbi:unnamed protein product [Dovyalis caffra]|uniref:Uncharacterized protein n=1 Tax=Dovyalis caffra TaxID=77055 RepID=A0AAV1R4I1_9ROSI|nr:unnamed protein product [Dovyalis caffra]